MNRPKLEYRLVIVGEYLDELENRINGHARDGWELVPLPPFLVGDPAYGGDRCVLMQRWAA